MERRGGLSASLSGFSAARRVPCAGPLLRGFLGSSAGTELSTVRPGSVKRVVTKKTPEARPPIGPGRRVSSARTRYLLA